MAIPNTSLDDYIGFFFRTRLEEGLGHNPRSSFARVDSVCEKLKVLEILEGCFVSYVLINPR